MDANTLLGLFDAKPELTESMTKMHFVALANALNQQKPADPKEIAVWRNIVHAIASVCNKFNPNFAMNRFELACGVDPAPEDHPAQHLAPAMETPGLDGDVRWGNSGIAGVGANSPAMMQARAAQQT